LKLEYLLEIGTNLGFWVDNQKRNLFIVSLSSLFLWLTY